MSDWKQFESESTEDLIQIIKWKDQPDYGEAAEAAFFAFTFRFRVDIIRKCEVICKQWGYDIDVASELANRVFERFWRNPNYQHEKRKHAKTFDEGIKFYLYGIANNELINLYRKAKDPSPYTGDERIMWDFDDIDLGDIKIESNKELIERREIVENALERLGPKHKPIYYTYLVHSKDGKNLPKHLREQLKRELALSQNTIRFYNHEAKKTISDYLAIWDKAKRSI